MNKLTYPLAAIFLAAMAPLAHASLEITYTITANGGGSAQNVVCGPDNTPTNQSVVCPNNSAGTISVTTLSAASNSPGGTPSETESAAVQLKNTSAQDQTITINVVSTGFTSPTAPPTLTLLSHIGGTVQVAGADNALSFISCVNTANTLIAGCPGTFNAPTLTPSVISGSFDGDSSTNIAALGPNYSLDEKITLTLTAGSQTNFSASTTLVQTPEPMSIALLGGILLFTTGAIRRKRNQASRG